ncbi:nucleotidyltransferase [Rhodobacter sphaeroides]|jgi:hypothetical protein|uniref:Nucleotidyltransferase n=1 Tax=Cereibacter sphaeroides (strain ATCC 17023 / DSM 158 / JCM 6121 / CCUG 31486 / LMG 2827 / NBRC 12203 / NCIMB 8253 / ATH 2.4.1.) TaxID=272943 RepID=Q3IUU5_CERS4|nr:nucleotidyltransferase [Cereibacter sphaeroides]ABA81689.1 hypothetical protein RSP_7322 [Cereibacter sphaeroides 2.4.1]AMJ49867.1 hypothetical protein APX01_20145 [Cereibacter sphaeroides]AMJ50175.1 hypothetical protein APX01_21770 [Cereibacter sphaeroides]ANS36496.1 hypothetical protein A3858_19700 [Cereibacter sphaeroides]ATN65641.1 hypothetical protein A3857_20180 [Cereibacter sphaeroides]
MPLDNTSPALDALLLGTVLELELSDRDRRVLRKRYDLIKPHLERQGSALAPYLNNALVYAQGSRAIGATIVHGADDDRFDLDGILEFPTPMGWGPAKVLDELYTSLEGFPDSTGIQRCTRCIQLKFAFMHLDLTPMDPASAPRVDRVGDIYHSPDKGEDLRVAANPYGFASWFRGRVAQPTVIFRDQVAKARTALGIRDRIALGSMIIKADTQVDDLPDEVDPIRDAPQVIALKLMKRYLNLRYANRKERRPPSVYLSKLAAMVPVNSTGLCSQLEDYANLVEQRMAYCLATGSRPEERNPALWEENFNDRWPKQVCEMQLLQNDMRHLRHELAKARISEAPEIRRIFSRLFGERATVASFKAYTDQLSSTAGKTRVEQGRGYIAAPAILPAAAALKVSAAPAHHFHCGVQDK